MRIHRVELTGFGPYKNTEVVDLDVFADDGVFLITGRTGAGKSSILDAITFALFGSIPRYDGGPGEQVRSDHIGPSDTCSVVVEFTVDDQRYRVQRSPEHLRPKVRGEGMVKQVATAEFARWSTASNEWQVAESQVRNVGVAVSEVLNLRAEQFLQVILLAQGQFQEFLVADSAARRDLLRSLFQTDRFTSYSDMLEERAKDLRRTLENSTSAITAHLTTLSGLADTGVPDQVDPESGSGVREWMTQLIATHTDRMDAATTRAEHAKTALDDAREDLTAATSTAERQQRLTRARAEQAEVQSRQEQIEALRTRLDAAHRAATVRASTLASEATRERLAVAEQEQDRARGRYLELIGPLPDQQGDQDADSIVDRLHTTVEAADRLLGSLTDCHRLERDLPRLERHLDRTETVLADFDAETQALRTRRLEVENVLQAQAAQLQELAEHAEPGPVLEGELAETRRRLEAAQRAEETATRVERAQQKQLAAGLDLTRASQERDRVRTRQLHGYAATLAQSLVEGEACAVCGAIDHPQPATAGSDYVTDQEVDAAEAAFDKADGASRAADTELERLRTRLGAEQENAGGCSVADLAANMVDLEAKLTAVTTALTLHRRVSESRRQNEDTLASLGQQIDERAGGRDALVEKVSEARSALSQASEAVADACGEYDSVDARIRYEQQRREAARTLARSLEEYTRAQTAAETAAMNLADALAHAEFPDADAAAAAHADRDQIRLWQQQIRAHDAAAAAVSATLGDPDLRDLPDEPVDVQRPQQRYEQADAAHTEAVSARSRARSTLDSLGTTATVIRENLEAAAHARGDFELVNGLATTVRGLGPNELRMTLETFVLAAELEEIVTAANTRLSVMTDGRYTFAHSDERAARNRQSGLTLTVIDAHTGEARAPQSLSGGEKFQASLALALGLAEVVTARSGGVRLDTLFIDEGFGSLDAQTLETTMVTLDGLREGGRTIGLISHVEAMKESIPAKVHVDTAPGGWSTIRRAAEDTAEFGPARSGLALIGAVRYA